MIRRESVGAGLILLAAAAVLAVAPGQKKMEPIGATAETTVPVVNYVVASPRAFLMGVPIDGTKESALIGAVENFPRANGTLEIPVGTRVIFSLGQQTEAVWQEGTYGTIETTLTVQWFPARADSECDACLAAGLGEVPATAGDVKTKTETKGASSALCPWITIAADGARDTRSGPSVGYTKVGVPIQFTQAGIYCVRGIVSTVVNGPPNATDRVWEPKSSPRPQEPSTPKGDPTRESGEGILPLLFTTDGTQQVQGRDALATVRLGTQDAATEPAVAPFAIDTDVVLAKVHVVDRLDPGSNAQGSTTADPDVAYTVPMLHEAEIKTLSTDEDDPKDSGAVKLSSPGVFIDRRDQGLVIPF